MTALAGDLHPLLRRLYAARGVRVASELDLGLNQLVPVGQLDGIAAAVELLCAHFLKRSADRRDRRLRCGRRDQHGAGRAAAAPPRLRVDRLSRAESLSVRLRAHAARSCAWLRRAKPALIITVDNGVSSHAGVDEARSLGIDTLITDHHLAPPTLPAATALVNPNAPGNSFPSKALAGVGVAFYLMAALTREMQTRGLHAGAAPVADLLDLVALGTVADLVPLDRNNRVLVHQGLRRIRAGRCCAGVRALLEAANRVPAATLAADLGYPDRAATERRRPARRHVDRHPVPADRRYRTARGARGAARATEPGSPRARTADAAGGDARDRGHARRGSDAAARAVPVRRDLAPGRRRPRGLAREGPRASSGDRAGARGCNDAEGFGALGRRRAHPRRARRRRRAASGPRSKSSAVTRWRRG